MARDDRPPGFRWQTGCPGPPALNPIIGFPIIGFPLATSTQREMHMPTFVIGQDVVTSEPSVTVEPTAGSPLRPGNHRFQLVVVDDSGLESEPSIVEVVVLDGEKPTAVIDGPGTVAFGAPFRLSGARSSDLPPGRIVSYRWAQLS